MPSGGGAVIGASHCCFGHGVGNRACSLKQIRESSGSICQLPIFRVVTDINAYAKLCVVWRCRIFKGEGGVVNNFSSFYCGVVDTAEKDL